VPELKVEGCGNSDASDAEGEVEGVKSDGDAETALGEEATRDGDADGMTVETGPLPACPT
jgi:hypothetical protein